jgi:hypothetical protein
VAVLSEIRSIEKVLFKKDENGILKGRKRFFKRTKKVGRVTIRRSRRHSKVGIGSGWVGVVSVERGDRDASNGTG